MIRHFAIKIIVFILLSHSPIGAQTVTNEVLAIKHSEDFEITGKGSSKSWNSATWFPLNKFKGTADYKTQAKMLYSDEGIYVLYECSDKKITATLQEDFADLYKEDVVEIFFWTDQSTRLYFEYELSPLNYELPIIVPNFKGDFFGWRPWHYEGDRKTSHKTTIQKDQSGAITGWVAEFFIPFALLKPLQNVPPKKGTQWKINLYRIDYDQQYSSWVWQPVKTNFHDIDSFGNIVFD